MISVPPSVGLCLTIGLSDGGWGQPFCLSLSLRIFGNPPPHVCFIYKAYSHPLNVSDSEHWSHFALGETKIGFNKAINWSTEDLRL